jgi:hypothetical protein
LFHKVWKKTLEGNCVGIAVSVVSKSCISAAISCQVCDQKDSSIG